MSKGAGEDDKTWKSKSNLSKNEISYLIEIHSHLKNEESFRDIFIAFSRFDHLYNRSIQKTVFTKMFEYRYLTRKETFRITFRELCFHLLSFYNTTNPTDEEQLEINSIKHFLNTGSFI